MDNQRQTQALSQSFTLKNGLPVEFSASNHESLFFTSAREAKFSPGTILDAKYRLTSLLGEGGMGAVYLAHHLMLKKDVALKTIHSNQLSVDALERFEREVKSVAALQNPYVVQIFDFGLGEDNQPYYTMELLHGQSLSDALEARGALTIEETLAIFMQVSTALKSAHNKGIIHRDLKPANIFLHEQNGQKSVKLVDFGIAKLLGSEALDGQKLTATGTIFGSPLYMSPEQSLGLTVDVRSDIYSLGCSLTECLTGKPPYMGHNAFATFYMHQQDPIPHLNDLAPNRSFPAWLDALVQRMLTKNPDERIQTCEEVLDILQFQIAGKSSDGSRSSDRATTHSEPSATTAVENKKAITKGVVLTVALSSVLVAALLASLWNINMFGHSIQEERRSIATSNKQTTGQSNATITEPAPLTAKQSPAKEATKDAADSRLQSSGYDDGDFFTAASQAKKKPPTTANGQPVFKKEHEALSSADFKEIVSHKDEVVLVAGSTFNNNDLKLLKNSHVQKLDVADSNLDNSGAEAISQCPTITFLRVSNTKISKPALLALAKLPRVGKVYLEGLAVDEEILAAWGKNSSLRLLSLRSCTGINYKSLSQLQNGMVADLALDRTKLDDSSLLALSNFRNLGKIGVSYTDVTADSVEKLCRRLPKLEIIQVIMCPKIHFEQVEKLESQFKKIRFDTEHIKDFDSLFGNK